MEKVRWGDFYRALCVFNYHQLEHKRVW